MKIEKIELFSQDMVVVSVEGFSHAKPTFPADITPQDLETELLAWEVRQREVDVINASNQPPPLPLDISDLKKLEGIVIGE
jgi:hypothetical protein